MKDCRVEASVGFCVFLCAFYFFNPADSFFPFLIAAGLHELGHILTLRLLHHGIHRLKLTASGLILETGPLPYLHELFVSLSGPAVNFALLFVSARRFPLFALVNLCLFLYNMLPIFPLDGGRALRAMLHLLLEERPAQMLEMLICALCFVSILSFCIYLTCVWHAGLWPVMLAGMLVFRIMETNLPLHRNFS